MKITNADKAYAIANNAIYFDDNSDYRTALWEVCSALNPEKALNVGNEYIDIIETE